MRFPNETKAVVDDPHCQCCQDLMHLLDEVSWAMRHLTDHSAAEVLRSLASLGSMTETLHEWHQRRHVVDLRESSSGRSEQQRPGQ